MPIFQWIHLPLQMLQPCNAVVVIPIFQWMYPPLQMLQPRNAVVVIPIFQWMYPLFCMLQPRNNVGVILIFQWMCSPLWILSPRNSVRVVPLIARGWRGMSLPRVNIHKEIQRHRCCAFSMKSRLQWNLLWQINQKKRNTYGVVPHKLYANPG